MTKTKTKDKTKTGKISYMPPPLILAFEKEFSSIKLVKSHLLGFWWKQVLAGSIDSCFSVEE